MKKIVLIYGLLLGAVWSIHTFTTTSLMLEMALNLLPPVICLYFAARAYRKLNGGFATFGQLVKLFVPILALCIFSSKIVEYVAYHSMSTEQLEKIIQHHAAQLRTIYEFFHFDESKILEREEESIATDRKEILSLGTAATEAFLSCLLAMLLCLIPAAAFKKERKFGGTVSNLN